MARDAFSAASERVGLETTRKLLRFELRCGSPDVMNPECLRAQLGAARAGSARATSPGLPNKRRLTILYGPSGTGTGTFTGDTDSRTV